MKRYKLNRDITKWEFSRLNRQLKKDDIVYEYTDNTYGSVLKDNLPVTYSIDDGLFFELPKSMLIEIEEERKINTLDGNKHKLNIGPYDPDRDTIKIEGTIYSGDLFRAFSCFSDIVGQILRIDKKENGVITVTNLSRS